ncbi:MAG: head-tail connector protein [Lachnospiraceae bacterium]|nr:head-tail connector protein [Lachnospiraceae bacterium]
MSFITVDDAKTYLRMDSSDEDALIGVLLDSAFILCADVARLTEEQRSTLSNGEELEGISEVMRIAVLYALGYLYEHREEADHHDLTITLRSLLFAIREGVW